MLRDHHFFIKDIKHACEKILRYTQNLTFAEFYADEMRYDAVIRNLEIIGEAAKSIPKEIRDNYSEIEWKKVARYIAQEVYF